VAKLVPALRHNLLWRNAPLKKALRSHTRGLAMTDDFCAAVACWSSHQIAAHAPKQREQSRPEQQQRGLEPIPLHEPEHALVLMESVQRFVHPNHGPPVREKIQQH